jgi:hypothetical protein
MVNRQATAATLDRVQSLGLINQRELATALGIFEPCFAFTDALAAADSIHIHIKVADVATAPDEALRAGGGVIENGKEGYVKYAFPGGVNVILSSINVSEDDLVETPCAMRPRPFVDHIGIDLRRETVDVENRFENVPQRAAGLGWSHVPQGAPGRPVFCCHVEVGRKHWVYPPGSANAPGIPLEFAFGALKINPVASGCDLRPAPPGTVASGAQARCAAHEA